ncbi:MAG: nitronate monooxygenase [Gammaproteobacteria bacterium]|nr:nitronate monooxygenase [Gammaproteobacteria bacterium]
MEIKKQLIHVLGVKYPIIQAPMAGGATTPELVAAVSNAGALGSLGAGYLSPEAMQSAIQNIRALTDKPFAVNLFIPNIEKTNPSVLEMEAAVQGINQVCRDIGMITEAVKAPFSENFEDQMQVVIEEKVPVFSFTFGLPLSKWQDKLKQNNTRIIGTATCVEEAKMLLVTGVDAIALQGLEAGGHRGSFKAFSENQLIPLSTLMSECQNVADNMPLIASGGIADGVSISNAMQMGAAGVQIGTAFLTTHESGVHPAYKKALLELKTDKTVLTKTFSGKLARGIDNTFIQQMRAHNVPILDYPAQNILTQKVRDAAKRMNNSEYMSMWAGQSAMLCQDCSVSVLIKRLVNEIEWRI